MVSIVVERRFDEALSDADLQHLLERITPCLDERDAHWVRSYLADSRDRLICLYQAPDAESVRQAFRVADLEFESVWRGDVLGPDSG